MGRLILIVIAVVVLVWLVRRALAAPRGEKPEARNEDQGKLVACAHCGVNLPRSEARTAGGRHYCSEEHWRLGPKER
ncbi:MAG: PP0621 family protein [Pseudomonadota bacterium]